MKRLLTILVAVFLFLAIFNSCNGGIPEETSSSIADTTAEKTEAAEGITLFAPGVCEYRIVYPSDDTDEEFNAARRLQAFIEEKCGVKPEIVRSKTVGGDKADPAVKEILLSYVDFEEFDVAVSRLGYGHGIACVVGNKIVVTGHEREGFTDAFAEFIKWIEEKTADGKLVLSDDFELLCESNSKSYYEFFDVPGYPGGMIEDFSSLGDKYYQVTIYDTDAEMYESYSEVLAGEGYSLYSENEISGNFYSTYTREDEMLYYYYCSNSGETRVVIAEDVLLPSLDAVEYKKICEPAYIVLSTYNDEGKISGDAQGCIIRFEDGTFMVYDGGNKNNHQAKHIYDTLLKYAPDPQNVTIRAWVFSHFHSDHTGAFQNYVARYKNLKTIKIESFIYNFCNTTEQTQCISAGQMTSTESAIKNLGGNIPVYKCLTGQIYRFPGMDLEILATMSDFIPLVIGFERADAEKDAGDGNSMSTVIRLITPEGNTCMLTGDATNIVLDCMVDRYGAEYLDSDIVTTPHHAHNRDSYRARNATIKFYNAVKPEVLVVTSTNMNKFTPTNTYPYEVNVHVINTYDPEIYLMNAVRLISLSTLKEIK